MLTDGAPDRPEQSAARRRLDTVERRAASREILQTAVRSVLGSTALFVAYYIRPDSVESTPNVLLRFVLVVLVAFAVVAWQIRAITRAVLPWVRAVEALVLTVTMIVLGFATAYLGLSQRDSAAFNEVLNRTGALYFTVTTLSTVGYGDIHARTDVARVAVMIQMVANVAVIGASARLILNVARRRSNEAPRGR